jgi:PAS domain S-box-containing protein
MMASDCVVFRHLPLQILAKMSTGGLEFEIIVFKKIFECAPDAIVTTDSQGRIVRINAQTETLFGYSPDELLGQLVEVLVPERLRSVHLAHRESEPVQHLARPFGSLTDLYARRKDGSEFPADIMLNSVEIDEGQLAVAIIRDLTDRKRTEEMLRESEESFQLLKEGVQDYAIFRLDPEGRVASCDTGAERITGWGANEIIGQHESPSDSFKAEVDDGRNVRRRAARALGAHRLYPQVHLQPGP